NSPSADTSTPHHWLTCDESDSITPTNSYPPQRLATAPPSPTSPPDGDSPTPAASPPSTEQPTANPPATPSATKRATTRSRRRTREPPRSRRRACMIDEWRFGAG